MSAVQDIGFVMSAVQDIGFVMSAIQGVVVLVCQQFRSSE